MYIFTAARDASGSAVGAGSGVGEVQPCPSSDHVFAQLCGSCFLFSVSFIFSGCSSGQCVVVFPSSAVCVRCWFPCLSLALSSQICHAGSSVTFHFFLLTLIGFSRFFCGTHLHRHMFPFLCIQFPCSRFCSLCARSFREFV